MFLHKNQKEFYSDYAIKDGQSLNEANLNLFGKRLKKELDDINNLLGIFSGMGPIPYSPLVEYEDGEIVSFNGKNYIAQAPIQGKEPGKTDLWLELTDAIIQGQGLNRLNDYLSKYNQTEYNPEELQEGENTTFYHPATVKFVEDRIKWYLKNSVITNSDRLDGFHASYFATLEQLKQIEDKVKVNDFSRFEPYNIPFTTTDLNTITTTPADKFTGILTLQGFNDLYSVLQNISKYDIRFDETKNKILATELDSNENQQSMLLCISGPFKGFGVNPDDYVNGTIAIKITLNLITNQYSSVEFISNISKILTQEQYDAIGNKSEYINYCITANYTETEQLVSYLKLFSTNDSTKGILRWSDPKTSSASRIVYNANRIPEGENDGTIIEDNITHNKYAVTGVEVDIQNKGYFKIFPKKGTKYYNDNRNSISVENIEEPLDLGVVVVVEDTANKAKKILKYKDPSDYVTIGCKVLIKESSEPENENDGTEIGYYERSDKEHNIEFTIPKSGPKHFVKVFPKIFTGNFANFSENAKEVRYTTEVGARIDESNPNTKLRVKPLLGARRETKLYFKLNQNLPENPLMEQDTNIPLEDLRYSEADDWNNLVPLQNVVQEQDGKWQFTLAKKTYYLFHKDFYRSLGSFVVGSGTSKIDWETWSTGDVQLNDYIGAYPVVVDDAGELYKLNPDDYTKTIDGQDADITTLGNDVFVKFPRHGYRVSEKAWSFYEYEKIEDYTITESVPANTTYELKSLKLNEAQTALIAVYESITSTTGAVATVTKTYNIDKTFNTTATASNIKLNKLEYNVNIDNDAKTFNIEFTKPVKFTAEIPYPEWVQTMTFKSLVYRSEANQRYFTLYLTYERTDDKNAKVTEYRDIYIPWDTSVTESSFEFTPYYTDGSKISIDIKNMFIAQNKVQGRIYTGSYLKPYTITETSLKEYDKVEFRNAVVRNDGNYIDVAYKCYTGDTYSYVSKAYSITAGNKIHFSTTGDTTEFRDKDEVDLNIFDKDGKITRQVELDIEVLEDKSILLNVTKLITNTAISTGKHIFLEITDAPDSKDYDYYPFIKEYDLTSEEYEAVKNLPLEQKLAKVRREDCNEFYIGAYNSFISGGVSYVSSGRNPNTSIDLPTSRRYIRARNAKKDLGHCLATVSMRTYINIAYMIVFQDCNSQSRIGLGYGWNSWDGNKKAYNSGACNKLGFNFQFANNTQRTNGWTQMKVFGIEDYWGNIWQWHDGVRTGADSQDYLWANGNFDRLDMYENLGKTGSGSGVWIGSVFGTSKGFGVPHHESSITGSDSTHYGDMYWQAANCAGFYGGHWTDSSYCGVFYLGLNCPASHSSVNFGARPAKVSALGDSLGV